MSGVGDAQNAANEKAILSSSCRYQYDGIHSGSDAALISQALDKH